MCIGNSLYEKPAVVSSSGSGSSSSSKHMLPYCEGVEILIASQEQAAPQQAQGAAAPNAVHQQQATAAAAAERQRQQQQQAKQQQQQRQPPPRQQQQQQQQPQQPPHGRPAWHGVAETIGYNPEDLSKFAARFQAVAARNKQSMQRALESAYTAAVKQLSRD